MLAFASAELSALGSEIDTNVQWRDHREEVRLGRTYTIAKGASDERDSEDDIRDKRKAGISEQSLAGLLEGYIR
jgi:hypothetical protein